MRHVLDFALSFYHHFLSRRSYLFLNLCPTYVLSFHHHFSLVFFVYLYLYLLLYIYVAAALTSLLLFHHYFPLASRFFTSVPLYLLALHFMWGWYYLTSGGGGIPPAISTAPASARGARDRSTRKQVYRESQILNPKSSHIYIQPEKYREIFLMQRNMFF